MFLHANAPLIFRPAASFTASSSSSSSTTSAAYSGRGTAADLMRMSDYLLVFADTR
jgi:hypothetical protein